MLHDDCSHGQRKCLNAIRKWRVKSYRSGLWLSGILRLALNCVRSCTGHKPARSFQWLVRCCDVSCQNPKSWHVVKCRPCRESGVDTPGWNSEQTIQNNCIQLTANWTVTTVNNFTSLTVYVRWRVTDVLVTFVASTWIKMHKMKCQIANEHRRPMSQSVQN